MQLMLWSTKGKEKVRRRTCLSKTECHQVIYFSGYLFESQTPTPSVSTNMLLHAESHLLATVSSISRLMDR